MAMSKGKMIASVSGGVFVLAVAALGYMLYDAYSTRVETEEELDGAKSAFDGHYSSPVFPSAKSIASVRSNETEYAEWFKIAQLFAARGDKSFSKNESPAAFKQRLQEEARRLRELPGGVDGKLVAQNFMFGFDKYLDPERGVLPESAAVQRLASQLDTVAHLAEVFSKNDAVELREVTCVEPVKEDDEDSRKPRKNARKKGAVAEEGPVTTSLDYRVSLIVRPAAFVDILNALTSDVRFMVVKSLSFRETADMIVDKMNAAEAALAKKDTPSSSGRRRRRRGAQEEQPEEEESEKKDDRLIVDPELDAPLQMDMAISVYDFGGIAQKAADASDGKTPDKEAK